MANHLTAMVDVRRYSSLASLLLLIGNYVLTCRAEFRFIWKSPMNGVKYTYIFARYFALIVQTTNFFMTQFHPLARAPVPPDVCNVWFLVLMVYCVIELAVLDAVLLLQIYALYERESGKKVLYLLPVVLSQIPPPFAAWSRHTGYDEVCSMTGKIQVHAGAVVGGFGVIIHSILFYMIFRKRHVAYGEAQIVAFVVNSGTLVFLLIILVVGAGIPYSYMDHTANPFIIFLWPSTLFSITSCWLIMSMRRLDSSGQSPFINGITSSFTDVATMEFPPQVSVGSLGSRFAVEYTGNPLEVTNWRCSAGSSNVNLQTLQSRDPPNPTEFPPGSPDLTP